MVFKVCVVGGSDRCSVRAWGERLCRQFLVILFNSFERIEWWGKDVWFVLLFSQGDFYILQVVKDLVNYLQTCNNFLVQVVLLVKRVTRHCVQGARQCDVRGDVEVCIILMCCHHWKEMFWFPWCVGDRITPPFDEIVISSSSSPMVEDCFNLIHLLPFY